LGFWFNDLRLAKGLKAADLKEIVCGLVEGGRLVDNRDCDVHCMRGISDPEVWDTVVRYAPDDVLRATCRLGNILTVLRAAASTLPPDRVAGWAKVLVAKGVASDQEERPVGPPKPLFVSKAKPAPGEAPKAVGMSAADERELNGITAELKAILVQIAAQKELLAAYGGAPSSVTGTDCDSHGLNCRARRQGGGESGASYTRRMNAEKALAELRDRRERLLARGNAIMAKYPGAK
jgi:hypothetical protein